MPAKVGSKRPDTAARNAARKKSGLKKVKNADIPVIDKVAAKVESEVLQQLSRDAGLPDGQIWTRQQFVEMIRCSLDLKEFGEAVKIQLTQLKLNTKPEVALNLIKTALEYSVQKAPDDAKDAAGLPPITIVYPGGRVDIGKL